MSSPTLPARWSVDERGCWIWLGRTNRDGYGTIGSDFAHRRAYEQTRGAIPPGLTVDHLCFVRACVNPDHMRLLTPAENAANNAQSRQTHCKRDHEFTPENTYVGGADAYRQCRACNREAGARYRAKRRGAADPISRTRLDPDIWATSQRPIE